VGGIFWKGTFLWDNILGGDSNGWGPRVYHAWMGAGVEIWSMEMPFPAFSASKFTPENFEICNSGCFKLNTDICGEIKSRHKIVRNFICVSYVFHNILRNIALFTFIPVKIYCFKGLWIKDKQYLNIFQ
jgi:hypothetical protein